MMRRTCSTALLICGMLAGPAARAADMQVTAEGVGTTREEAVAKALSSAVEQVTGVAVQADQTSATLGMALSTDAKRTVALTQVNQAAIQRSGRGVIHSYRILSLSHEDKTRFVARLEAEVATFKPAGLGNESRRRIAVTAFHGGNRQADAIGALLRDRISAYLTQTRRFAVLDRANDGAFQEEMSLLQDGEAPVTERVRVGQALGADYMITGRLRNVGARQSDTVIALTGEHVRHASYSAELDYQVVEIATRQVKWADTVRIATSAGGAMETVIDQIASRVGREIMSNIYPMRLIKFDDPSGLIINQGGMTLHAGDRLHAFLLGAILTDPYTKEPLGREEREVGIIEVRRVEPKISYARLVAGSLPSGDQEIVLRRSGTMAARPHGSHAAHRAHGPAAAPVIKLPFDP